MKKKIHLFTFLLLALACTNKSDSANNNEEGDLTQYVNPFIGTAFTGHTFPGATYPLGMMQPGPETGNFITYDQIMSGGNLQFHMTHTPKQR